MKKIFILSLSLVTLLISCKKNDDSPVTPTASILPKKLINDSTGETFLFTYEGNKLKESNSDSYKAVYKYTGNLITAIYEYKNDKLTDSSNFTYENDKLIKKVFTYSYISNNQSYTTKSKAVYTNNADGTIGERFFSIDKTTGEETLETNPNNVLTFANGNLAKIESVNIISYTDNNGNPLLITYKYANVYEYDSKNNAFKNVLGYNKLIRETDGSFLSINNILKTTITSSSIPDQGNNYTTASTNTYEYNANNYPVMIQRYVNGKLDETIRIEY
jgi:hypothetical protein